MKKAIIITALALTLIGCHKSDIQNQIDEYDLRKAKIGYVKDLMDIKEELTAKERLRLIDSLIQEEKTILQNDSN